MYSNWCTQATIPPYSTPLKAERDELSSALKEQRNKEGRRMEGNSTPNKFMRSREIMVHGLFTGVLPINVWSMAWTFEVSRYGDASLTEFLNTTAAINNRLWEVCRSWFLGVSWFLLESIWYNIAMENQHLWQVNQLSQ